MMDNEKLKMEIFERKLLMINGVETVEAFDDNKVLLKTKLGLLSVKGEGLAVKTLDLETGRVELEGTVDGVEYMEDKGAKMRAKSKSVLSRLIR